MKTKLLLLLSCIIFFACNTPDQKLTPEQILEQKMKRNDSLIVIFDSLMSIKIDIPQLIDSAFLSKDCLGQFQQLASQTGGQLKIVTNSKYVTSNIIEIIEKNGSPNADIMIMIDKTGSMEDDIINIKLGLFQIIESLKKYPNTRISIGTYGDKNTDGKKWYEFKNFENDFSATFDFINGIKTTGGGDFPESVYDGVYNAFQENFWKSDSKRIVILLGDAPSLDSALTDHTMQDIIKIAKQDKINMNFYPVVLSPMDYGMTPVEEKHMEKLSFIESVYPNPSNGLVSVALTRDSALTLELFDQKGKILLEQNVTKKTDQLSLYDYDNGVYIIRISDKFKNYDSRKIILNK